MSELMQVIRERSSIRGYKADPLSAETIAALIEAGLMAPTARNQQEVFISAVSTSDPMVAAIQNELLPGSEKTFYYGAPTLFFLSADDGFKWGTLDAGIAVQNMHLAAADMGLGSVIIGCIDGVMKGDHAAEYAKKLQVPEGYSFRIALAVGYPAAEKPAHSFDMQKNSAVID